MACHRELCRREMLQRLRGNDPTLTALHLYCDAADYMFHSSGHFMGSELEGALEKNTHLRVSTRSVISMSLDPLTRTLVALRGCRIPLSREFWTVGRDAASLLVSML